MKRLKEKLEKINQIKKDSSIKEPFLSYFLQMTSFIDQMEDLFNTIEVRDWKNVNIEELREENRKNYEDIIPENYGTSYANPTYAVKCLGNQYGQACSYLYMGIRKLIPLAYEQNTEVWMLQLDLFIEIYQEFNASFKDSEEKPVYKIIEDIIYWYRSDMLADQISRSLDSFIDADKQWVVKKLKALDVVDERGLYIFGDYVTENEVFLASYISKLPNETIDKMANTFTEGYRMGFVLGNKDLSIKEIVEIHYNLGFERVIRQAIANFAQLGLKPVIRHGSIYGMKRGFVGATPNKQCDYDHKEDDGIYMDKVYVNRKLDVLKNAYEERKVKASLYAGPAVMEVFGELPFVPENKKEAVRYSKVQEKVSVYDRTHSGEITNQYIKGEERSFTIIAFPMPSIGKDFKEIFDETIRINTLDYSLYQAIQQKIIDVLDTAKTVLIKGQDGNRTNLTVNLIDLKNPAKETKFENCVADVNIPVGEVFTSPVLEGTNGVLHVKKVFLNELEYKDLEITFKDGKIATYHCANFKEEKENQKFLQDNLLFHRETLPLGEFAIGTNTTAYVMAKKYKIADKLPILIAEKMGPHFALGDTCYSHAEDVTIFNPDGKEIIAKDNSVSILRNSEHSENAYMNCHTDITIPYEELGGLWAVHADNSQTTIIEAGKFVLPGVEELNKPFG